MSLLLNRNQFGDIANQGKTLTREEAEQLFNELSGLIHAYSLMRPGGYQGMDVKGVKKRLKEKSFAANVSRDDINDACNRAAIPLDELIAFIIPRQAAVV